MRNRNDAKELVTYGKVNDKRGGGGKVEIIIIVQSQPHSGYFYCEAAGLPKGDLLPKGRDGHGDRKRASHDFNVHL